MHRPGPTFLIAGAPRSGTTWLYHLLDRHPDVFMAKPARPEPKFFLVDELYERGFHHYVETWFDGSSAYTAAGEKSTNYLESSSAADRIHRHVPDVRLVFILREPTQRVCNVIWSGVRLAELLADCEPRADARFVWSAGADYGEFGGVSVDAYVKDLPLDRAKSDVLVAYEMNGAPLTPDHGFPARLVYF